MSLVFGVCSHQAQPQRPQSRDRATTTTPNCQLGPAGSTRKISNPKPRPGGEPNHWHAQAGSSDVSPGPHSLRTEGFHGIAHPTLRVHLGQICPTCMVESCFDLSWVCHCKRCTVCSPCLSLSLVLFLVEAEPFHGVSRLRSHLADSPICPTLTQIF